MGFVLTHCLSSAVSANTAMTAAPLAIGGNGSRNGRLFAQRGHSARRAPHRQAIVHRGVGSFSGPGLRCLASWRAAVHGR